MKHASTISTLIRYYCIMLILVLLLCSCSVSPTLENADYYTYNGYYDYALQIIQPKAKEGEAWAMLRLAGAYQLGHGVSQDNKEAVKWYEQTAFVSERNIRETNEGLIALYHLANFYLEGKGVDVNPEKSYEYIAPVYEKTQGKSIFYCCPNDRGGRWITKEMIEYTYFKAKDTIILGQKNRGEKK